MAQKWLPASALTGGAEDALDAIDGNSLSDTDRAIVISDRVYFYVLDADSGAAESVPDIIAPDSNAGTKRWLLTGVYVAIDPNYMLKTNSDNTHDANTVSGAGENNVILCGESQVVDASDDFNLILYGQGNTLQRGSISSIAGGFANKLVDAAYDAVLGGDNNLIWSHGQWYSYSNFIAGGVSNSIRVGYLNWSTYCNAILSGEENQIVDSDQCVVLGGVNNVVVEASNSVVSGAYGHAYLPMQTVLGGGAYDDNMPGKIQASETVLGNSTTTATPAALEYQVSGFDNMTLRMQRFWALKITVAAMQTGGSAGTIGNAAFWNITAGFKNIGAAAAQGTITLTGASDAELPVEDETFVIDSQTFTWKASPASDFHVQTETTRTECLTALRTTLMKNPKFSRFAINTSLKTLTITALPNSGTDPNAWDFTESCSHMTMDGSGLFGGTTAGSDGTVSLVGVPRGTGAPDADTHDAAIAARGTLSLSGVPIEDDTFVIDTQTFVWKTARSTTGEVTLGADAAACATNMVDAIETDLASVAAETGTGGDTVILTAATAGSSGNVIVMTTASTNMTADGSGTLGGTTPGDDRASLWEVAVTADDTDKSLQITVTGEADKTIHWTARVEMTEVG